MIGALTTATAAMTPAPAMQREAVTLVPLILMALVVVPVLGVVLLLRRLAAGDE